MSAPTSLNCAKCRRSLSIPPGFNKMHIPCPHCGGMNPITATEKAKPRRRWPIAAAILILPIAIVGIFWSLTMTMGADSLRPEIAQLSRGRKNAIVTIKAPAPFVLTYTIHVPSRAEGQASMRIRKYYYWFITYKREVPESEVPERIRKVWE